MVHFILGEPHPWASGATFGSATHNGSNGTLSISSGRPSQEEDFVSRYEQRIMFIYNAVAGGVGVQFILTYVLGLLVQYTLNGSMSVFRTYLADRN